MIISTRDDGYGTLARVFYMSSQIARARFLGFKTGGHAWVGHNVEVTAAIADLVATAQIRPRR
jgi:hypothetical protein